MHPTFHLFNAEAKWKLDFLLVGDVVASRAPKRDCGEDARGAPRTDSFDYTASVSA